MKKGIMKFWEEFCTESYAKWMNQAWKKLDRLIIEYDGFRAAGINLAAFLLWFCSAVYVSRMHLNGHISILAV